MEDLEKQFITSSNTTLTQEAKKLCEDILVVIGEQDEMLLDKAKVFCDYFLCHKPHGVETTELEKRCIKYEHDLRNYRYYKNIFRINKEELSLSLNENVDNENLLDMQNKRISKL